MDENEEIDNEEGLDFDILIENVRNILEEPEFKKLLKNIGISADELLEEIAEDMENEESGVEPSENEKESSYSKKCVRAKVYEKLMGKFGTKLKNESLDENEIADNATSELFLSDFMKALQSGNYSKMHKAVLDTGVLPVYDENGNEIYIVLTPAQQKVFTKMVAESQKYMNAAIENADLKDFEEHEEHEDELKIEEFSEKEKSNDEKEFENISPKEEVTIESLGHRRYDVKNTEYLEMHPEQRDATFVEASAGTNIEEFARDLLLLKKNTEDRIIGVFNGTTLDVSKYDTAAEIQDLYNGEIQRAREDETIRKKGEFLEESWYYYQFYKVSKDENARSEIEEYNRSSNQSISERELIFSKICEPKDGVDMRDFLEALKYEDSLEDSFGGKNYIKVHGMLLCTSEFSSVDELAKKVEEIKKVQAYNKRIEEHPEKYPNAKKQEIFVHSKAYYKSQISVDRVATNEQVEAGNADTIVIKPSNKSAHGFLEAARYFGARNPNILLKGIRGEVVRPSEYETLNEMQAARIEQAQKIIKKQNEKNAEDRANGVVHEEKNPYIFEKDLSDIQKQRWKIEHPKDFDAQLEDSRKHMGYINKLTLQTAGMSLDDIVADVEDFKVRGFDVTVNLFGKVLDTRMCKDIKDIRGLVEETIHTGKSKQVAEQRKERETQVFDNDAVGVDLDKIDSVLALMTEENVSDQKKASDISEVAKQMENDGKELGIVKTTEKNTSYGEKQNEEQDDEHNVPEER